MDAIDILGSLLGRKAGGSGGGADILRDILNRGSGATKPGRSPSPQSTGPVNIERESQELEDLLNVAVERNSTRQSRPTQPQRPAPTPRPQAPRYEEPQRAEPRRGEQFDPFQNEGSNAGIEFPQQPPADQNDQAVVLIRAMVNAAKSDGKLSPEEQQSIFQQIGDTSQEAIQFLRDEFARPMDVREFAWSVPLGMEQKVYATSLMTVDLDTNAEANYLRELAHGLRLTPEICNQLHQRNGTKKIF